MALSATYIKLKNGEWGLNVINDAGGQPKPGQQVKATTAAGMDTIETIGNLLHTTGQYTLCTIAPIGLVPGAGPTKRTP